MRLPNGFGSVHKLSGKRRNPWRARKTVGWEYDKKTGRAKQKYVNIGYFHTKQEALQALAKFNETPYDISKARITFQEVYEKWSEGFYKDLAPNTVKGWLTAYHASKSLYNIPMRELRVEHLEGAMQSATDSDFTKGKMRQLFIRLFQYALKYEIVDRNYGELCDVVKTPETKLKRTVFTDGEIEDLWKCEPDVRRDMVLVQLYSGFRAGELCELRVADVHLKDGYIVGGLKTEAGKNRMVPIHSRIEGIIQQHYDFAKERDLEYLFVNPMWKKITMDYYGRPLKKYLLKKIHVEHASHDARHTFITRAKQAGMNEYVLKLIVGHVIKDITESVYTHRSIEELKSEIEKIK